MRQNQNKQVNCYCLCSATVTMHTNILKLNSNVPKSNQNKQVHFYCLNAATVIHAHKCLEFEVHCPGWIYLSMSMWCPMTSQCFSLKRSEHLIATLSAPHVFNVAYVYFVILVLCYKLAYSVVHSPFNTIAYR